jgi:Ca2+-binding EF-hand superfamily protein
MKKGILIILVVVAVVLLLREKGSGPNVHQNGISTNQFADDLMLKYDINSDGFLDVNAESFLKTPSEKVAKIESRGLLFTDADAFGNSDGSVSKAELMAFLQEFDTDHDGEISSYKNIFNSLFGANNEWSKFDEKYAERYKYDEM